VLKRLALLLVATVAALAMLMPAILAGGEEASIDGKISHFWLTVKARSFETIEFYASRGTTVKIVAYIFDETGNQVDIDVQIIRPDGSLEYPKTRVTKQPFVYIFDAPMSGTYRVVFDNTYSILTDKYVDLAIAGFPKPQTVTVTRTFERTLTLTETRTATVERLLTVTETQYKTETRVETKTETATVTTTVEVVPGMAVAGLAVVAVALLAAILALLLRRGQRIPPHLRRELAPSSAPFYPLEL